MAVDPDLLAQAKLVRRYASETGKLSPELATAIARADNIPAASRQEAAAIESEILRAQSDVIRTLGLPNITVINTWYSESERWWGILSRVITGIFLLVSLLSVIVFTFTYNDSTGRLSDIISYCSSISAGAENNKTASDNGGKGIADISLRSCLDANFFPVVTVTAVENLKGNYNNFNNIIHRVLLYSYPPSILKITNSISSSLGLNISVISNPTSDDLLYDDVKNNPGQVLYSAGNIYNIPIWYWNIAVNVRHIGLRNIFVETLVV